jgi:signal transduction histidine kinase
MSTMRSAFRMSAGLAIAAVAALSFGAFAADPVTKDEAVAMVKKAVTAIKAEGAEKAYAEISNPTGPFVDRDLYIVVYGLDGMVLAHGANKSRVGTNQIDDKDVDGKAFVKERVELAKQNPRTARRDGSLRRHPSVVSDTVWRMRRPRLAAKRENTPCSS